MSRRETGRYDIPNAGIRIHCVGEDRPGMLAAISRKLNEENLSVENITTEIRMKGQKREFVIDCDCSASHKLGQEEVDVLYGKFSDLKEQLGFDTVDVRVHLKADAEKW